MAIDPISLTLMFFLGAATGATVAVFWDEIKAWAVRAIGYILDGINRAIEVTSDAYVSLVKEGARYYKEVKMYVRDVRTNTTRIHTQRQEVSNSDVPEDVRAEMDRKQTKNLLVAQYSTP